MNSLALLLGAVLFVGICSARGSLQGAENFYGTYQVNRAQNGCVDLSSCCALTLQCTVDLMYWATRGSAGQATLFDGLTPISGYPFDPSDTFNGTWVNLGPIDQDNLVHCPYPLCPQQFEYIGGETDRCIYQPVSRGRTLYQPPYRSLAECLESSSNQFNTQFQYYQSRAYCLSFLEQAHQDCLFFMSIRDSSPCTDPYDLTCNSTFPLAG
eukprot:CAMPEP_0201514656 /NCGR_PEP_ID=MMETSP0161_2-20130828/6443_1 /ASSEMBLY_ACC=CAM_ASM_000251 /TAXON_ID=180227 /ORGANISM="Neoparamoeba aestuarina, Strain SoJaBio B1-5/56/2" /LENGTH=210 /DNA_ID=CAMNT_0047911273 /DNA_START=26 /DNA_END=658 /DNA_ORIENTATION=-